jgi:hypothetical protein
MTQKILVFQQNQSAKEKIKGILQYGQGLFTLEMLSIDDALPPVVDDPEHYLPSELKCDLVLDYLKHPDLSYELARLCQHRGIPLIASGKRWRVGGVFIPPT